MRKRKKETILIKCKTISRAVQRFSAARRTRIVWHGEGWTSPAGKKTHKKIDGTARLENVCKTAAVTKEKVKKVM